MTLIKSISGIRGTIGGSAGNGLTPFDILKYTAAFGQWAVSKTGIKTIVIGRDARISGPMVSSLVVGTLQSLGIDVVDLGLSTTPTVEMAVPAEKAAGGIILTASHNPKEWNALKLLNHKGEFISAADGAEVLALADSGEINFAEVDDLGKVTVDDTYLQKHIDAILALPLVDKAAIAAANFSVAVDAVNSSGGFAVPALLNALGVQTIYKVACEPHGNFEHNPEPLPAHLAGLSAAVTLNSAQLGIAVDPDVDRLCFVSEDGSMFGEEYTLVAIADYILKHTPGNTVSNLSSTRALRDVTQNSGNTYTAAAVGEVNVIEAMKATNAIIGGEGNGGVIYPELHYGRDALVGIALFLSHLAHEQKSLSVLKAQYPVYFMSKNKITLEEGMDVGSLLDSMSEKYKDTPQNTIDGVKIDFQDGWAHLRRSNTEPIVRIYTEAGSQQAADQLAEQMMNELEELAGIKA
ncbi:phosphomannomutase [Mucilaginibacter yixingensis]|uniref:Phosphomannomutase n=1 Tax=Mucilaginibacter yixingensis TaxID=1295612 RepID=A0A2T5J977_9SPHI|nr:phosphoglucosamine mutase [Mucilaginibacter yixingensis]PTQ96633.1 phosphomannomutase [Mucilaginibacter yixingensis]